MTSPLLLELGTTVLALDASSPDVSLEELVEVGDWVFVKVIKKKCWSHPR